MQISSLVPYRVRRSLSASLHNFMISGVLKTAPIAIREGRLVFLSMVCHRDVLSYLVALKSIYRRIKFGSVVIVDDGSLTARDKDILRFHVPGIRIIPIASVQTAPCPRGGAWERLLTILDLTKDSYVIQVDADLLALGDLQEVVDCVREGRAFTLAGDDKNHDITSIEEASARARQNALQELQWNAEAALDQFPELHGFRYVRGCAGFAGFPQNDKGRELAVLLTQLVGQKLGKRWEEWGTEQFCSNFIIANFENARVLTWPDYTSYFPQWGIEKAELLHFLGSFRFHKNYYGKLSRAEIASF